MVGKTPWEIQTQYGTTIEERVEKIIEEWKSNNYRADVEDVWFGLPKFYKSFWNK